MPEAAGTNIAIHAQ